ncbi:amino acid ABC transporter permease [Streptomyces albireticuli]|uniref:Amino acid ABC transporter permease n=1 Tax=Streptomyces albireticuli TaxID=1940 RepID=A0A2A2DCP0_9ACTN|nr:amino acid ABC transporter permease [Streptomyces albireticuli]MCD9145603.1 amino acid ABC transporter permease [Streptomyces albireticuli]MCD9165107.1 amino acid ABC transporter permease [Streptomyces albireticuli]MCD9195636.1 amino acid ABC transporter permease [Streptomyces albireticuli]PAU50248.1 amino acid ABC transporter permease [Streptomyces albireticuli]
MSASVLYDVPGPKARVRNRIYGGLSTVALLGLLGFIVYKLDDTGQFQAELWDDYEYSNTHERILDGLLTTLKTFAVAAVLSLALGAVLASARLSDHRPVRWLATTVVEFFRAMPLLIMIFLLFAAVFTSEPMWALVIGLTLYNGSVQAEIFRSGINAVPKGQSEAAYALGLRKTQVMTSVLIPQAVRSMLPSIISQLVVTLKDTSLGFIILYEELLFVGRAFAQQTEPVNGVYAFIPMVIVFGSIYILLCLALSSLATWVERRTKRSRKGAPPAMPANDAALVADAGQGG